MKASDWKFEKFIPDLEDMEAEAKAGVQFLDKMKNCEFRVPAPEVHAFTCGFFRGCAWMKAKMNESSKSEQDDEDLIKVYSENPGSFPNSFRIVLKGDGTFDFIQGDQTINLRIEDYIVRGEDF